jgi:hypothetical protein
MTESNFLMTDLPTGDHPGEETAAQNVNCRMVGNPEIS